MERFCRSRVSSGAFLGNVAVIGFLLVQGLDGVFTYVGIAMWGRSIEANPLVSSAVALAGPGAGLVVTKLIAAACGIVLHLRRVHTVIAVLTAFYLAVAVLPWTAVLWIAFSR